MPPCLAHVLIFLEMGVLAVLPRLVLNSWPQAIFSPQPPKLLGLQHEPPRPAHKCTFLENYVPHDNVTFKFFLSITLLLIDKAI